MTRAREIVAFLQEQALSTSVAWPNEASADAIVNGVTEDRQATTGQLAWLSPRVARDHPERLAAFCGTLLICPDTVAEGHSAAIVVGSPHPKVAFSLVVDRFFPDLTRLAWPEADVRIHPSASVSASAQLAPGVTIGAGCVIRERVLIGPNSCLANTTVHDDVVVGCNCSIGLPGFGYDRAPSGDWVRFPHVGRVVIESTVEIGSNVCIDRGALGETRIERGAKIDNLVHIAHNVVVGRGALVIANAMIAGSARIGANAWVAPSVSVLNQLDVGAGATLGIGAVVIRNVDPNATVVGNPAKPLDRT